MLTPYSPVKPPRIAPARKPAPAPVIALAPEQTCPDCGGQKSARFNGCRECRPGRSFSATTSPGTAVLLRICERRGVPLARLDRGGYLRIVTADDLT